MITGPGLLSHPGSTVCGMTSLFRPVGPSCRPAPDVVNEAIRRLMEEEPASEWRAAEYTRLLALWAEAVRADGSVWGKAA